MGAVANANTPPSKVSSTMIIWLFSLVFGHFLYDSHYLESPDQSFNIFRRSKTVSKTRVDKDHSFVSIFIPSNMTQKGNFKAQHEIYPHTMIEGATADILIISLK